MIEKWKQDKKRKRKYKKEENRTTGEEQRNIEVRSERKRGENGTMKRGRRKRWEGRGGRGLNNGTAGRMGDSESKYS